ncbi:MAG: hypothetical protein IIB67_09845 [Proteobacteria bacterium]|nr:hypothetical protein [Pseudomonadota bacterium]
MVDDIIKGARGDTRLSKLRTEEILVDHIAQVEARATLTGLTPEKSLARTRA